MTEIYDLFLHIYHTLPVEISTLFLAWIVSITITQPVKFVWPFHWHPKVRERLNRALAFFSAFLFAWLSIPTVNGFILALCVGVWSPVAYIIFVRVLGNKFPFLKDVLSADVRGTVFGERKENK